MWHRWGNGVGVPGQQAGKADRLEAHQSAVLGRQVHARSRPRMFPVSFVLASCVVAGALPDYMPLLESLYEPLCLKWEFFALQEQFWPDGCITWFHEWLIWATLELKPSDLLHESPTLTGYDVTRCCYGQLQALVEKVFVFSVPVQLAQ